MMRCSWLGALVMAGMVLGCSGSKTPPAEPDTTAAVTPPAAAGSVVEIRMTGDGSSTARFEPDHLTVKPGTTLRFINVSGGPHNISFWPDSIPAGAGPVLQQAMPTAIAELQGELLAQPNQTYDLVLTGAPAGEYKGYCTPHLALGMRIWIAVEP